jgi:hypothetical protein
MATTVERVANSIWLRATERLLSLAGAALLAIVIYVGNEKSDTLDGLSINASDLAMTVKVIIERQNGLDAALAEAKRSIKDMNDGLGRSRRADQTAWDDFRERLARLETQTAGLIKSADQITQKLDSIADRLPRREGLLEDRNRKNFYGP